jgi:hypothetical protein
MNTFQKGDRVWLYGEDRRAHRAVIDEPGHIHIGIQVEGQTVITTEDADQLFPRTSDGRARLIDAMISDHRQAVREVDDEVLE